MELEGDSPTIQIIIFVLKVEFSILAIHVSTVNLGWTY